MGGHGARCPHYRLRLWGYKRLTKWEAMEPCLHIAGWGSEGTNGWLDGRPWSQVSILHVGALRYKWLTRWGGGGHGARCPYCRLWLWLWGYKWLNRWEAMEQCVHITGWGSEGTNGWLNVRPWTPVSTTSQFGTLRVQMVVPMAGHRAVSILQAGALRCKWLNKWEAMESCVHITGRGSQGTNVCPDGRPWSLSTLQARASEGA